MEEESKDDLLVNEIKQGNQKSFNRLFQRYYQLLVTAALKFVVEKGATSSVVI